MCLVRDSTSYLAEMLWAESLAREDKGLEDRGSNRGLLRACSRGCQRSDFSACQLPAGETSPRGNCARHARSGCCPTQSIAGSVCAETSFHRVTPAVRWRARKTAVETNVSSFLEQSTGIWCFGSANVAGWGRNLQCFSGKSSSQDRSWTKIHQRPREFACSCARRLSQSQFHRLPAAKWMDFRSST